MVPVTSQGLTVSDLVVELDGATILNQVDLRVETGSALVLLGPSGCGKTTLLRVLAGLQPVVNGEVYIGDRLVSSHSTHVPPERRRVGMVFQDWALFPHLSVAANIAFGLPRSQRRGLTRQGAWHQRRAQSRGGAQRVDQLLDMLNITELAHRLPSSLSGGQQQRVALARALAPEPSIMLLDEPFSSLDTTLRSEVRDEVSSLLRTLGVTSVFVTHDQDEAFVLGDQVAVMRAGQVVQQGTPAEVYDHPVDRWVAGFVGEADIVPGWADRQTVTTTLGTVPISYPASGPVEVLLRPESLTIEDGDVGTVERYEFHGHDTLYWVRIGVDFTVRVRVNGAPKRDIGERVGIRHSGPATVTVT